MSSTASSVLSLVGDVMIDKESVAEQLQSNSGFHGAVMDFNTAATRFINLEMPLSRRGYAVPKHANLRSNPEVIQEVKSLGTHGAALANNHMMDFGPQAMLDTLEVCHKEGIKITGAGIDIDEAIRPAIFQSGEHTIGLLSFASTLPIESEAGVGKPGIAPIKVEFSFEMDTNLMLEQPGTMPIVRSWVNEEDKHRSICTIKELKSQVDLLVVALHWGVPAYWLSPFQGILAEYQRPLAHTLIEAGADIVWGHHSHSLHPVEVHRGKPIFYSLGNFIFEEPRTFMEPESVIVHVMSIDPLEIELTPICVDSVGFPRLLKGDEVVTAASRLEELSRSFETHLVPQDGRIKLCLDGR